MTEQEIKQKAIEIVGSYGYHEGDAIDYNYAVDMVMDALNSK